MKILIVNRFFGGAQIPTGRMAEDMALKLVEAGHEVVALASTGEYVGAARCADGIRHTAEGIREEREARGQGPGDRRQRSMTTETPADRTTATLAPRGTLRVEEVRVPKWMPRALAWVWFTWQARKRIPLMDWDVCVLMTDPPLLPLLAARVKAAGASVGQCFGRAVEDERLKHRRTETPPHRATRRVAVWLMDLYPEALAASGRITKSNPLYRWYFSKRQQSLAAADLLICLGDQQKNLLGKALTEMARTAVVPPWDDREEVVRADDRRLKNLALYAGNLGEAHCFEEILAAAPYLPEDWTIRLAARGAKLSALKAAESELKRPKDEETKRLGARVEVTGYASEEETPKLLASARVHLITMSPGWEGIVVPSKLYGCIRTGRPVLFIGPENADTAREIRAHDWGKVLPPGASGEEVASAILELAARPTRAVQLKQGAAEVAELIQDLATE
jgi:hypothetical protein